MIKRFFAKIRSDRSKNTLTSCGDNYLFVKMTGCHIGATITMWPTRYGGDHITITVTPGSVGETTGDESEQIIFEKTVKGPQPGDYKTIRRLKKHLRTLEGDTQ